MSEKLKRFTISIAPCLEQDLNEAQTGPYRDDSHSKMLRDLIARGLNAVHAVEECGQE